jgi:hypothetical protein
MHAPRAHAEPGHFARLTRSPSIGSLWLAGTGLLWLIYVFVFLGTTHHPLWRAAIDALCNVLPLSALAVAVRAVLKAEVMRRATWAQALWHGGLATAFAFTWYATLVLLLALADDLRGQGFTIVGFGGPALTWQVFQGLLLYATIAAVCYAVRGGREAASVTIVEERPAAAPLTRYLIRSDDELTPVDVADIISITGAQDYSEVATMSGQHLVRLSLAEFEARLDPARFVRVHRSAIINLHRLARTEPAGGGRLLAHMANGAVIAVSRSGVQALRKFVI